MLIHSELHMNLQRFFNKFVVELQVMGYKVPVVEKSD